MANTYTQIHIHSIFAVSWREALVHNDWESDLHKYISGIIQNYDHKLLAINGMPDHQHVFFGMRPTQSLSDLMQQIKGSSSEWINDLKLTKKRFNWQSGYGAFSYSKSQVDRVIKYIDNQKKHHKKINMIDEFQQLLDKSNMSYDKKYLFHMPE